MFEDGGFEIYKATIKTYVKNEIYNTIGGPDQSSLMMRKILDHVNKKKKNPHIARWLAWLDKLTGPIQKKGVTQALKELEEEAETEPNIGQNIYQKEDTHKRKRSLELED